MSATVFSLGSIEINSGEDVNGVEWWGVFPQGWNSPRSAGRVVDRGTAPGSVIVGARQSHRSLLLSKIQVFAPDEEGRWAAQALLEATCEAMITTPATLTVSEPDGDVSMDVRYVEGLAIRVRSGAWFEFDLPLVALSPMKSISGS
ncbi:MAG TPA: hypothetical protein VM345_01910 [Acidimicrobiales bacterium]|nr:hypothetical protein [Acidimicrobiales bacterium]